MANNHLISVLVPVYNINKYIRQCVDSIISQTYTNWELILVDDGSTDDCPQICDNYADVDTRIRVIHKANGGLASARNAGLAKASGEWIMMVDGDDWIENITLETCIQIALEKDLEYIKFSCFYEYNKSSIQHIHPMYNSKDEYLKAILSRNTILSIWGGLYKKNLFEKINPKFVNGLNYGEDYSVIGRLLYNSKSFYILQEPFYHYRQTYSGYVHSPKWIYMEQLIECEKINYNFFSALDQGSFIDSLRKGRANIKTSILMMIASNFKEHKKNVAYIKELYKLINTESLSNEFKLILKLADMSDNMLFLRCYLRYRKMIVQIIKHFIKRSIS